MATPPFYCESSQAELVLDGDFHEPEDWTSVPEPPDSIEIGEWQKAYIRFYQEVPDQFSAFLPECGNNAGGSRFEKLPHHAWPTYCLNFKNYVGHAVLAGFRVKVSNRKITENQFNAMLNFLCDEYAALIFSFKQIAGLNWQKDKAGRDSLYLQYLLIRRHLLRASPDLDGIAALVHGDMHQRFVTTPEETPVDRIRELDSAALMQLFSGATAWGELAERNPLCDTPLAQAIHRGAGKRLFPASLQNGRRHATVNTPENRFVKFFLGDLAQRLANLKKLGQGTFLNPELGEDIERLEKSLGRFLVEPRWREVGEMRLIPLQSTVLHRRAGYRELFRLYSLLQLVSRHDPLLNFNELADIKNVPLMYEYWCFFQVKRLLDKQWGPPKSCVPLEASEGEQLVREGLRLDYGNGVSLHYNACCDPKKSDGLESYSHSFYPDILLTWGGRKLILDAKYKGFYSDEQTIGDPKDEDVDKMHCYREAIRDVWGAFALYPGETTKKFQAFDARRNHEYEGVGALALRPSETEAGSPANESPVAEAIRQFFSACAGESSDP